MVFKLMVSLWFMASAHANAAETSWSISDTAKEGWGSYAMAKKYHHNSHPQSLWAEQALRFLDIQDGESIADFGCGDGKISARLAARYPHSKIVGFDISVSMLKFAKSKFPTTQFPHLTFEKITGTEFSTGLKSHFDKAVSTMVFHVVPDPLASLKNIARTLRPNGEIVLTYISAGDLTFVKAGRKTMEEFGRSFPNSRKGSRLDMRTPDQAVELMRLAGFRVDHIEDRVDRYHFADKEEFHAWLVGTTSANWKIPSAIESKFFTRFIEHYETLDPQSTWGPGFSRIVSRIILKATLIK